MELNNSVLTKAQIGSIIYPQTHTDLNEVHVLNHLRVCLSRLRLVEVLGLKLCQHFLHAVTLYLFILMSGKK
jgi:hypothetical protein